MNISPINNINLKTNIHNNKQQNFKGLWGKTYEISDCDSVLNIPKNTSIYYYYPFLNEPKEVTESAIDGKKFARIDPIFDADENRDREVYAYSECRICAQLPFTESEYKIYREADESTEISDLVKEIHALVKEKYISGDSSQKQKRSSAINDKIDSIIKHNEKKNLY